jgi:hypothetical protein
MSFEHLLHLDDRPQATAHTPGIPPGEELLGAHRVHVSPEPAELLFDRLGPCRLQSAPSDGCEPASLCRRQIGLVEEPELPRPLESVIVFGLEGLVLRSSHLIDCLSQVLGDIEPVVHEFGVRGLVGHCVGVGGEHAGGHGLDLLPLLDRQCLEDRFRGGLGSLRGDVQDAGAVDVGEHGDIVVPFPKALLVDADVANRCCLASLKASFDGTIHDRLGRIPGESEEGGRGLDGAARLQDFDGEGFEEQGETAVLPSPWWHDRLHSMVRAAAPRQPGDQLGRELHRVEVPPAPFFRVVGPTTGNAAFWAPNARTDVRQADFNSTLSEPKVNSIDSPGVVAGQKPGVVRRSGFKTPQI